MKWPKIISFLRLKIRQYLWAHGNFKSPYLYQPGVKPELLAFAIDDVATITIDLVSVFYRRPFLSQTLFHSITNFF